MDVTYIPEVQLLSALQRKRKSVKVHGDAIQFLQLYYLYVLGSILKNVKGRRRNCIVDFTVVTNAIKKFDISKGTVVSGGKRMPSIFSQKTFNDILIKLQSVVDNKCSFTPNSKRLLQKGVDRSYYMFLEHVTQFCNGHYVTKKHVQRVWDLFIMCKNFKKLPSNVLSSLGITSQTQVTSSPKKHVKKEKDEDLLINQIENLKLEVQTLKTQLYREKSEKSHFQNMFQISQNELNKDKDIEGITQDTTTLQQMLYTVEEKIGSIMLTDGNQSELAMYIDWINKYNDYIDSGVQSDAQENILLVLGDEILKKESVPTSVSEDVASEPSVSEDVASEDSVSEDVASEDSVREELSSEDSVSEDVASEDSVREELSSEPSAETIKESYKSKLRKRVSFPKKYTEEGLKATKEGRSILKNSVRRK